jgi:hypothetical protein
MSWIERRQTLVQALAIVLMCGTAAAQTPASAAPFKPEPFAILDNSFFVEEALNQEAHIFQNIFGVTRQDRTWQMTFTQEWPAPTVRHQLSYTVSANSIGGDKGFGDVVLNYRMQVLEEGPGRPAFAPRISALLPTGRHTAGGGEGGLQINLPFSKQQNDFYFHWNGGFTWLPRGERTDLVSPSLAGSAIYRLRPMLNLMLESVLAFDADDRPEGRVARTKAFTISPGVRGGWNLVNKAQLILGAAVPITRVNGTTSTGAFGYFSYELPFGR